MWVGAVNCFLPQFTMGVTISSQLHIPDGRKTSSVLGVRYKSVRIIQHLCALHSQAVNWLLLVNRGKAEYSLEIKL